MFPQLSGGNQQKVILAKAFNTKPTVVLLDEPTAGVDVGAREVSYEIIRRYAGEGVSFMVSSSDVDDLLAICDRVLVMGGGRIKQELKGQEITEAALLDSIMDRAENPIDGPVPAAG
jgi:ribose transport system ATP-binding protein